MAVWVLFERHLVHGNVLLLGPPGQHHSESNAFMPQGRSRADSVATLTRTLKALRVPLKVCLPTCLVGYHGEPKDNLFHNIRII